MENKLVAMRKTVIEPEVIQKSVENSYLHIKRVFDKLMHHWHTPTIQGSHRTFNSYGNRDKKIK